MKKYSILGPLMLGVLAIAVIAVFRIQFMRTHPPLKTNEQNIRVVGSFYPLSYFASQIGGPFITVINLTPPGAEPHDFEPKAQDVATIERSQLLIINGVGFEPWGEKLKVNLENRGIRVVETAQGLANQPKGDTAADPHVWLDPLLARHQAQAITQALIAADPIHASSYEVNSLALYRRFDALDTLFRTSLGNCKQHDIVTSHAAFGYLASRYGLTQVAIQGITPDEDPSPQRLAHIAELVKEKGIQYIFFETLVSPRLADAIARETGARTIEFNPIEGLTAKQEQAGADYFSVQEDNIRAIRIALECK